MIARLTLAAAGLATATALFGAPANAQTAEQAACVVSNAPDGLAAGLADDMLASMGAGTAENPAAREMIEELATRCARDTGVPEEDFLQYSFYSLSTIMVPELSGRMTEAGIEADEVEAAMHAALNQAEDLAEVFLILAPAIEEQTARAEDEEYGSMLLGAYVALRFTLHSSRAELLK